jgi:DNA-binding YbaB/EbfC family protein
MFKGPLKKQIERLQDEVRRLQEEAATRTVEASSGGGMVRCVCNGRQEVVSIEIAPEVLETGDREMLQDLVLAAVNEALRLSRQMMEQEFGRLLPPGFGGL